MWNVNLFVKPQRGRRFTIRVEANDTIDNVKAKIQEQSAQSAYAMFGPEGILPAMQRLHYARRKLEDGHRLSDYGIEGEATISLRWSADDLEYHFSALE